MITRGRLIHDLRAAGVTTGRRIFVHSSLRSLGKVKGGADTVIDALMSALGPRGTLIMPTFTYSLVHWSSTPFDPSQSPSQTGQITDSFWRRSDVRRTHHPTHSCGVWGLHADEVAEGHRDAVGEESPLGWLLRRGGLTVQIGTDHVTNTALHLCEELARLPYLEVAFTPGQSHEIAHRVMGDGRIEEVRVEPVPGSSKGFSRVEPLLAEAGIVQRVRVGEAETLVTSLPALVGVVVPALQRHPGLLLSLHPDDESCQARRARLHRDTAVQGRDLIDLFIEGFPRGGSLRWSEREVVEDGAQRLAEQALDRLGSGDWSLEALKSHLRDSGVSVDLRGTDAMQFSLCEPREKRITIWRGALARLSRAMGETTVPCGRPLRRLIEADLADLALAHEGFHLLMPTTASSLQGRIIEEVAARLFADRLLSLPVPSLLVDVWLMHWAGAGAMHAPPPPPDV
ncbi:AAC(3) family N-acetyltransferase [Candidatus Sumerlaeota bacterium]|nr:AAC(3) family N-acetyltransferase [Candidatus Sumerlaeota bacterium]